MSHATGYNPQSRLVLGRSQIVQALFFSSDRLDLDVELIVNILGMDRTT